MMVEHLESYELIPSLWARIAAGHSFTLCRDYFSPEAHTDNGESPSDCRLAMNFLGAEAEGTSRWAYTYQENGLYYGSGFAIHEYGYHIHGILTLDHSRRLRLHQTLTDVYQNGSIIYFSEMMSRFFADIEPTAPWPQFHNKGNSQYETGPF